MRAFFPLGEKLQEFVMFGLSKQKKSAPKSTFRPELEALEQRDLMSGFSIIRPVPVTTGTFAGAYAPPQPTAAGLALINSLPDTPVKTAALADYQRDGIITRNDMIDIFYQGTTGFTDLTNAELTSLQTLVTNGTTVGMPYYVQNLGSKVLADVSLGAMSPAQSLHQNVNNFFLGLVRPDIGGAYPYAQVNLPLWNASTGPSYMDVKQDPNPGANWLVASIKEVAYRNPADIQRMFIDNGDGTYSVGFHHGSTLDYVTVDNYLPGGANYVTGGPVQHYLWPELLVKAYAQENAAGWIGSPVPGVDSYQALLPVYTGAQSPSPFPPGDPAWAFTAMTGLSASSQYPVNPTDIANAWSQGHFVVLHTSVYDDSDPATAILNPTRGGMWYAVVGVGNGGFTLSQLQPAGGFIQVDSSVLSHYFDIWAQAYGGAPAAANTSNALVVQSLTAASPLQASVQPMTTSPLTQALASPSGVQLDNAMLASLATAQQQGIHVVLLSSSAPTTDTSGGLNALTTPQMGVLPLM
jgi:hypothetical protein